MKTDSHSVAQQIRVSSHSVVVTRNRAMLITYHGDCTPEDALRCVELIHEHGKGGPFEILMDAKDLGDVNGAARAYWIRVTRPYPFTRLLVYAPHFSKRILIGTLYRAGRALLPHFFQWDLIFVHTLEEALALIEPKPASPSG